MKIIGGFHAIEETLKTIEKKTSGGKSVELLYFKKSPRISEMIALAEENEIGTRRVSKDTLERRAGGIENRGVLLLVPGAAEKTKVVDYHERLAEMEQQDTALVLILDGVTDPHNLGAILRSADLFDVDLVIIPQRRSAQENNTVKITSAGASAYVPLVSVPNLARSLVDLKEIGFWIYGAQAEGEDADKINFKGKNVIVMGSEGTGLHRLISEACDGFVSIPTGGHIDSLNVSVATGILMYEVRRQGRTS